MLDKTSEQFAKDLFGSYYSKFKPDIKDIKKREFGFGNFEKKILYRHMSFSSAESLSRYMKESTPPFMSYSPSLYDRPDARPMEKKGWIESPLIFDIDATDLRLECQANHGSSWVCQNCHEQVKNETTKLIEEFLIPDFGFSSSEIRINFSGNRGYHVYVNSDDVLHLDSKARREISNYITASNISVNSMFPTISRKGTKLEGPKPADYGWRGRIARGMITALNGGQTALMRLGMSKSDASLLQRNRAKVILGITTGNWDKVSIKKKGEFWSNVINTMTIKQGDSIDGNVTSSIYHLLRVPKTLHGDTGLVSREISSLSRLEEFDPMRHSVVFKRGERAVRILRAVPEFIMDGMPFGPFAEKDERALPTYAALYLVLKRYAAVT